MTTVSAIELGRPAVRRQSLWRYWRGGLRGSEFTWALAFLVPYIGVFLAFVVYPVCYGLWMGSEPRLYTEVFSDPIYQQTVVNTIVFVAFGVNLKLFFALLLSGFFMRPGWWVKGLLLTLLATIFLLGNFNTVAFITGGGPANSTHLLATLGIRNAFDLANPRLGVAVVMSALPLLIPLVIILMRRLKNTEAQL